MSSFRDIVRMVLSPIWLLDTEMNAATRNILAVSVKESSHWLDIGCGLKPFASSFDHATYTGIDIEVSGRSSDMKVPDKFFDGINIPYEDSSFDGLLCTQVLEHVENLDLLLAECNRVIKVGGGFVVSVPFLYIEHEQPYDFRRFTSYGLMLALTRNGFKVSSCLKCLSAIETIATIFSVYVSNNVGTKNKLAYILSGLFITLPALVLSKYLAKILPDNRDLFCVLISSAVKTAHLKG
jgi:SAM-dependent methyltransferase